MLILGPVLFVKNRRCHFTSTSIYRNQPNISEIHLLLSLWISELQAILNTAYVSFCFQRAHSTCLRKFRIPNSETFLTSRLSNFRRYKYYREQSSIFSNIMSILSTSIYTFALFLLNASILDEPFATSRLRHLLSPKWLQSVCKGVPLRRLLNSL